MVPVIPAKLGWRNPEMDGISLRLYACDAGESPRWSNDSPAGRTIEVALDQRSHQEGDRFLVVPLGDRFVDGEFVARVSAAITAALEEARNATD